MVPYKKCTTCSTNLLNDETDMEPKQGRCTKCRAEYCINCTALILAGHRNKCLNPDCLEPFPENFEMLQF